MSSSPLLRLNDRGLYCEAGDFYVDPRRGVSHAIVTHAHSDHARRGSENYYCFPDSIGLMRSRLGQKGAMHAIAHGEKRKFGSTWVSLHHAGHILGSSQVRIERGSEVWVVSGDYKREPDPSCPPFEVVECDTFVTEATFGEPRYKWKNNSRIGQEIFEWWQANAAHGVNSLLFGYSLGKSQRIMAELSALTDRPIWVHRTITPLARCYEAAGIRLVPYRDLDEVRPDDLFGQKLQGALILAPPSITREPLAEQLGEYETAFASGWMLGGRRGGYSRGFVMSDHADWPALIRTIFETRARQVYLAHGGAESRLERFLRGKGWDARPIESLI